MGDQPKLCHSNHLQIWGSRPQNKDQRLNSGEQQAKTKITDQNDDCLEKIFDHLDLVSLFNVAVYVRNFDVRSVTIVIFNCIGLTITYLHIFCSDMDLDSQRFIYADEYINRYFVESLVNISCWFKSKFLT